MKVARIPANPEESDAIRKQIREAFSGSHFLVDMGLTLYVHGGGFEYSNPDLERLMAYRFSLATGRPAIRVEYRLAPAHPYPAALEDVLSAYRGVLERGVPASRIILIGESAGATLLLSALLALKDSGEALPAGAVAISPQTDFTLASPSIEANEALDVVNRAVLEHVRAQYLRGADPATAPQSPLYGDLAGLPPILIAVGSREVLLDDARRFADALAGAGCSVQLDIYEDMSHAFHAAILAPDSALLPTAATLLGRLARWSAQLRRHELAPWPDWSTGCSPLIATRVRSGQRSRCSGFRRLHLVGIDPDYRLHVSDRLLEQTDGPMLEALKRLAGQRIHLPARERDCPDRDRLALLFERYREMAC